MHYFSAHLFACSSACFWRYSSTIQHTLILMHVHSFGPFLLRNVSEIELPLSYHRISNLLLWVRTLWTDCTWHPWFQIKFSMFYLWDSTLKPWLALSTSCLWYPQSQPMNGFPQTFITDVDANSCVIKWLLTDRSASCLPILSDSKLCWWFMYWSE